MLVREAPSPPGYTHHVLDYRWDGFVPRLEAYDLADRRVEVLPLDVLDMAVSEERRCVGSFSDGYRPCPSARRVAGFTQCRSCMGDWAPVQRCVFEPQCTGDRCEHRDFCGRRHVVYLAFYGTLVKVGMTSAGRVERRGIEQGADAIAPVLMCRDRQEARALEKEVSRRFKLPQELRVARVAAQWTHPPSRELIANAFATHRRRVAAWREVMDEGLLFLDRYPVRAHPRSPPAPVAAPGRHRGEVMGVKGRYLIFRQTGGGCGLLDLSDLPSRLVSVQHPSGAVAGTPSRFNYGEDLGVTPGGPPRPIAHDQRPLY